MAKWSEWGECNGARQRRTRLVTKKGNLMKPKTEEFQECSTSILAGWYMQAIIQYKKINEYIDANLDATWILKEIVCNLESLIEASFGGPVALKMQDQINKQLF